MFFIAVPVRGLVYGTWQKVELQWGGQFNTGRASTNKCRIQTNTKNNQIQSADKERHKKIMLTVPHCIARSTEYDRQRGQLFQVKLFVQ